MDDARQADTELEERLLMALRSAKKLGLPEEDIKVLCYSTGIQFKHVMYGLTTGVNHGAGLDSQWGR